MILLMAEILPHLGCQKPCQLVIAGFQPSTVVPQKHQFA